MGWKPVLQAFTSALIDPDGWKQGSDQHEAIATNGSKICVQPILVGLDQKPAQMLWLYDDDRSFPLGRVSDGLSKHPAWVLMSWASHQVGPEGRARHTDLINLVEMIFHHHGIVRGQINTQGTVKTDCEVKDPDLLHQDLQAAAGQVFGSEPIGFLKKVGVHPARDLILPFSCTQNIVVSQSSAHAHIAQRAQYARWKSSCFKTV